MGIGSGWRGINLEKEEENGGKKRVAGKEWGEILERGRERLPGRERIGGREVAKWKERNPTEAAKPWVCHERERESCRIGLWLRFMPDQ